MVNHVLSDLDVILHGKDSTDVRQGKASVRNIGRDEGGSTGVEIHIPGGDNRNTSRGESIPNGLSHPNRRNKDEGLLEPKPPLQVTDNLSLILFNKVATDINSLQIKGHLGRESQNFQPMLLRRGGRNKDETMIRFL
jgi:hypothetical protein